MVIFSNYVSYMRVSIQIEIIIVGTKRKHKIVYVQPSVIM